MTAEYQYDVTTAEEAIETIDELITAAEPCLTDEELQGFGAVINFLETLGDHEALPREDA